MTLEKFPVQRALDLIDGVLVHELSLTRKDPPTRSKTHFFEVKNGGRQFAVVVGDPDESGKYLAQQTRIILEEVPGPMSEIEVFPELEYFNGSSVHRSFSKLVPPAQRSVLVGSEAALRRLLEWYAQPATQSADSSKTPSKNTVQDTKENIKMLATNVILYGPPGTGKTFSTFSRAVLTCDGFLPDANDHDAIVSRYEELRKEGRISFVTFHQSYGYEEFVEGLRPQSSSDGQVSFNVVPGAFRLACDAAKRREVVKPGLTGKPLQERTIFKMSLGASTNNEGAKVFQYCLEHECLLLGWGDEIDFSDCGNENAIKGLLEKETPEAEKHDSSAWFVNYFKHELKVGDIVIVSNGNTSFRAIAEVTGDYHYVDDAPFHQMRPVKWLAVYEVAKPTTEIFHKSFTMASLYKLSADGLNYQKLEELLAGEVTESAIKPHLLIIDEINRANISKVFGELITLLEPDKRTGGKYPVTVKLPYSGDDFSVPSNLHVLGTMNTADRSIALLDTALRRRFDFEELMPDPTVLAGMDVAGINLEKLLTALNARVEILYDRDHTIGHGFFIGVNTLADLDGVFRRRVLPLLQEYFYENWSNVRRVLNDLGTGEFVIRTVLKPVPGDGDDSYDDEPRIIYAVNKLPFAVAAYKRIYGEA